MTEPTCAVFIPRPVTHRESMRCWKCNVHRDEHPQEPIPGQVTLL